MTKVADRTDGWIGKLDAGLRTRYEELPAAHEVVCMIFTDTTEPVEVEEIIRDLGGVARRVSRGRGLAAQLPIGGLSAVAASSNVLRIDSDREYVV